ncbi:MAG: ABC transporter ATP-binding protein [Chitinophagaceae bacterium]|nr:ABC transporter ATP-binding protein [Chitinophagaceae bacterium]MCZ2395062.1 ABC transporter ATP-binding protein/permease [Chitinophagales bacterium]
MPTSKSGHRKSTLLSLLKPYKFLVTVLLLLAFISNGLNLVIPKIVQKGIDDYSAGNFQPDEIIKWFAIAAGAIFLLSYIENFFRTFLSEKVSRDMRNRLVAKISDQNYEYIRSHSTDRLLTNITSDIDALKTFISQAIVSLISSAVLIIGTATLLLNINLRLGLIVLIMVPIIIVSFLAIFKTARGLFQKSQGVIDQLNKIINESILASALIRVLNAQLLESQKFITISGKGRDIGISIVKLFSTLIPVIVLTSNLAQFAVLTVGGRYIILGDMTLGEFAAFNSYISILIFPILVIGFTSNIIARASASFRRIRHILDEPDSIDIGTIDTPVKGNITLRNVSLQIKDKYILRDISFDIKERSRTAIIGPTAAGKSQLLNILTGLIKPTAGEILYDGIPESQYKSETILRQTGIVFQGSTIFNLSLRENIAFNKSVTEAELSKAIRTAEIDNFIGTLPEGIDTPISERGTNLSGGQKQRIMLARALSVNPAILILDDFTARVDAATELKIGENLTKNYPDMTIISVTQKIEPVKNYDQIILIMQGELIASGTHEELLKNCPEYMQIHKSQQSLTDIESTN